MTSTPTTAPTTRGPLEPQQAAPARRRVLAQAAFETRAVLRNGEQLLLTVVIPALLLVGLTRTSVVELGDSGGVSRIDLVAPGVLALAVMTTSFTSQAIATAFDRRNGVLRLLGTTPLGRGGLLTGKVLAVLAVEVVQALLLGGTALALGWAPDVGGLPAALLAAVLGTAAFTSLAFLLAGTLRAEGVLAVANLLLVLLVVGGGVLLPADLLPAGLEHLAPFLPSGALGDAMRAALIDGAFAPLPFAVLAGWTVLLGAGAARFFRWQ
jgi:ABC-2 type transport system permease protein